MIHYRQMEKPDRDQTHAMRAEDECRNLLVQFPNSKFAPRVQQLLRNIQEVIAEGEMRRGSFYHNKGSHPAAANRLQGLTDQYPLFSRADEANWLLGNSYLQMGDRYRDKAGIAYARIVREYPLSGYVEEAKKRLQSMELPIPEADPVAYARMKYELENRDNEGMMDHALGIFKSRPNTKSAARSGTPAMTSLRPGIPVNVPLPGATTGTGVSAEVTATQITDSTALDTQPDARNRPAQQEGATATPEDNGAAAAAPANGAAAGQQAAPNANQNGNQKDDKKGKKKKDNKKTSK